MIGNFNQALEERNFNKDRRNVSRAESERKKKEYIDFLKAQVENNQVVRHMEQNEPHPLEVNVPGRREEIGIKKEQV